MQNLQSRQQDLRKPVISGLALRDAERTQPLFRFEVLGVISVCFSAASLFLGLCLFPSAALAQKQVASVPLNGSSIEWFYEAANPHSDTLLLKALQYTAPYPGFYQELSLDRSGHAFTARIVPDWARQGAGTAKLDDTRLGQIREMLTQLTPASDPPLSEPQPGQLRTWLVFYNGKAYEHYEFNGALPVPVQTILDVIRTGLEKARPSQ